MPKKKRKILILLLSLILILSVLVLSPLFPFLRSLAVMGVYSKAHESRSLMAEEGIDLHIPGGLSTPAADWYPFVMTFVADEGYAAWSGDPEARLTILYNFPAFDYRRGCSRLFDTASPYYNSFYGAYLLRGAGNDGLKEGRLDEALAADIARFDFFHLVLGDFGLKREDQIFDFAVRDRQEGIRYAGYDGWTRLAVDIRVNGSSHPRRKGTMSYLQYGAPNFDTAAEGGGAYAGDGRGEEFAPVDISGLVYGRYFPEWDLGLYFYVMGEEAVCLACDEEILSRSRLGDKK